jgi:methionyl-tRNA formyltransferase
LRIVFFGNSASPFSNRHFSALVETGCDPIAVVDAPPARRASTQPPALELPAFSTTARRRGIPVFEPASSQEPGFLAALGELAPDLFLAVGFPLILKPPALALPRLTAVNFHASLLPAYRGKHPVFWCLRHDERWSGLTVHVMDPGIDTGDLLYQVRVRTRRDDTVDSLYERIMGQSVKLIPRLIQDVARGGLRRIPQQAAGGTYFSSVKEADFRLHWTQHARQLRRWITMTPSQCFTVTAGERIYYLEAEIAQPVRMRPPGEILALDRLWGTVSVGGGALRLRRVIREDGRRSNLPALCQALGLRVGDRLPGS